ncbi:hypothetical protein G6F65_020913 [Rhizopus arrhizus]|nr:hypothetical protein G6F65_020913 [Rhizopus arrhizus]
MFRSAGLETFSLLSHGLVRQVVFRVAFHDQSVDGLHAQLPELVASLRCPKGTHGPLRGPGHQQGLIERRQRRLQIPSRYLPFGGQECPERRPMLSTNKIGDGAPMACGHHRDEVQARGHVERTPARPLHRGTRCEATARRAPWMLAEQAGPTDREKPRWKEHERWRCEERRRSPAPSLGHPRTGGLRC